MRKHSVNNPHKLMGGSKDSLSVGQSILFTGKEIASKEGINADNTDSHEVNNPPQMPIASFRDSACALEFAGLIDGGIEPCVSDQRLMGLKVLDIAHLGQESSAGSISDSIDGSENVHFLNDHGLAEFSEDIGDLIEAFHQVQGNGYLLGQDKLLCEAVGGNRTFCCSDKLLGADRDLSSPAGALHGIGDDVLFGCSDTACGGELFEKPEHRLCKDICQGLHLREGSLKNSLDLIFCRSDEMGYGLSFSGKISQVSEVLGDGELSDGVFVNQKELSDGEGVFLIGLGLSQGQLCKIGDQKGIQDYGVDFLGAEEGEEIDVVAACGLHGTAYRREVTTSGFDGLQQSGESHRIHRSRKGEPFFSFDINACSGKRILGYVNTDKQRVQCTTSLKCYFSKAGEASRPILHGDKDSSIQSTYHGYGRQGTDSLKDSSVQDSWSSPAFPALTGKTHLYKRYNTNSM